jgi:superfamily II DNA or RNA helicase
MIPYALFNSKIIFEPFQYKPYFEFFEHTDRDLYIADEVGVGKTIEAGIIISELINADRNSSWIKESLLDVHSPKILVLAPPALCAQWKEELESKFMLRVYDAYSTSLGMSYNAQIVVYAESWQQLVKIEDDDTEYDLLVVDEVHNFRNQYTENPFTKEKTDSRRYKSLQKISQRAKRRIFMSATPIFNKMADLKNEIELLTPEYSITSSTKSVSKCLDFQPRIESVLVDLNKPERKLYNAIKNVEIINPLTKSAVYLHEGCSSMPCLAKTLVEAPDKFINSIFVDNEITDTYYSKVKTEILELVENDDYDGIREMRRTTEDPAVWGVLTAFLDKEDLREYGEEYIADKNSVEDSKLEQLDVVVNTKLTEENGYAMKKKHIVIFAHYIATCDYIYEHFDSKYEDIKLFLATGDNTKQEIDRSINEFKETCTEDSCDSIMICSDVCREGKNMQECQVIINYDLPFSPSIMQQRIGRIDRNGQRHTPLVFNLICNVDNDIHTYYEIIFEKIRIINSTSGICGIDVLRETNEGVQEQVLEEWKNAAQKAKKKYSNDLSALQNSYLKYLRKEKSNIKEMDQARSEIDEEIGSAPSYTDEEILQKMRRILFTIPNDELKTIREEAHCVGKREIASKLFEREFKEGEDLRPFFIKYIEDVIEPFKEKNILDYEEENDVYDVDLSGIKNDFFRAVASKQLFECFSNFEDHDGQRGTGDMYYDEFQIAFNTAVYKEVGYTGDTNGKSAAEFEQTVGERFEDVYVPLSPLVSALEQCN